MGDQDKTREQLALENEGLRERVAALQESEQRFNKYFQQDLIGMAAVTGDGRWLDLNDRFCKILGYSKDELLQQSWKDLVHPDDLERALAHFERLVAGDFDHDIIETRYIHKGDSTVYTTVAVQAFYREGGVIDRIVILVEDITARKQAEVALRAGEEFQRDILDNLAANIAVLDRQGTIIAVNAAWVRFAHENGAKLVAGTGVGTNYLDVCRNAPGDFREEAQAALDGIQAVLQGRQRRFFLEYPCHSPEIQRWFMMHATPLSGLTGGVIVAHVNITERKQAEEVLDRERQSLWRALQASDHERQIISYDIHDGLAQYLAAAEMQFQVHDSVGEQSPDASRKAYETAVALVRQAHSEARRLISEVRPPVIDESGIETAIVQLVHEQRRHTDTKIECHSDVQFGRLPPILENALYRIAQEALRNACKHSKSKNVTVAIVQEGQNVRLEVQDWGIGFDPTSVGKGSFGLEGIRQRVQLLGGRLTIESTPGSGTLVQVVVPILERQND